MDKAQKNIVFISHSKLTERIMRSYSLDRMLQEYNVQFWDIGQIFRPAYVDLGYVTGDYIKTIPDLPALELMLNGLDSSSILITDLNHSYIFRSFFITLKKYSFTFMHLDLVTVGPAGAAKKTLYSRLINIFRNPIRYLNLAASKVHIGYLIKTGKLRKFDYQFCRGEVLNQLVSEYADKNIAINSPDYDEFLSDCLDQGNAEDDEAGYAVFLDVYLPYHPDLPVMGLKHLKDPEGYFLSMNALFTEVEKKYSLKVIIAAHPSAAYRGDEFNAREIIHGETAALVKGSEFVLSHHSNSLAYAVLYEKPCLFCYTDEMYRLYNNSLLHHQNCYAEYLACSTYNITNLLDEGIPNISRCISLPRYKQFVNDYLTSPASRDRQSADIIINAIDSL